MWRMSSMHFVSNPFHNNWPALRAEGLMMQQAQLPTLAVLGGTGPEAGKKNSISRAAEAGLSDPCTALKVLSGEAKKIINVNRRVFSSHGTKKPTFLLEL